MYGYLGAIAAPQTWPATAWVRSPGDITALIESKSNMQAVMKG